MSTTATAYNLKNPWIAHLKKSQTLTGGGAVKHTAHYELDLSGSGMEYLPGDSLAVLPTNDPELVELLLKALGFSGEEIVKDSKAREVPIRQALTESYSITEIDRKLLKALAEKDAATAAHLADLAAPEKRVDMEQYLWGRDVLDLVQEHPAARFEPAEFVTLLKKIIIRLYSISSSLKLKPEEVHLTVATVRYDSRGRQRKGLCSNFLAERLNSDTPIPTFISHGKGFRLPDPEEETPIIMCGPGTGIAPFRSFLQERRATEAKGKAWLFFGETNEATCFFYRDEFEQDLRDGVLHHLTTAFSRDQPEKIYVQHRMLEESKRFYEWLEQGAIFYVCGDANRMAVDVDKALHDIIVKEGGKTAEEAAAYVDHLRAEKRYRRDVY